ncbi:hypothetical protein ACFFLM_21965 [Deinococcus oregonensis]|uniref:Uncharacterized protein n=1 Tax=Deinococcus oregonensis TaxID=1805970 RepID=A0ABV6B4K5_9DEIO
MTFRPLLLALTISVSGVAAAQAAYRMDSYVTLNGKTQPAFAWCDAPDRVLALTNPAKEPATSQPVTLARWLKRAPGQVQTGAYLLGPGEGAAGTIFVALNPASQPTSGGNVRLSNVQNVNDPAYRMSAVGGFKTPYEDVRCRYVPDAAFLGATAKRTIIIWDNGGKVTYATRNFDGTPGVLISGGKPIHFGSESGWGYEFQTADGFTYSVARGDFVPKPQMTLSVSKGGKTLQTESFLAYSVSTPLSNSAESNPTRQEQP